MVCCGPLRILVKLYSWFKNVRKCYNSSNDRNKITQSKTKSSIPIQISETSTEEKNEKGLGVEELSVARERYWWQKSLEIRLNICERNNMIVWKTHPTFMQIDCPRNSIGWTFHYYFLTHIRYFDTFIYLYTLYIWRRADYLLEISMTSFDLCVCRWQKTDLIFL